jgi:hypothetical protein
VQLRRQAGDQGSAPRPLRGHDLSPTTDLLGAGSFILAALAVLVTLWYPSIQRAREIKIADHKLDAEPQVREITRVLRTQSGPLLTASLLTTCALLPKAIGVIRGTVDALADRGLDAIPHYDAVQATFVLVVILIGLLTAQTFLWTLDLRRKRRSAPTK